MRLSSAQRIPAVLLGLFSLCGSITAGATTLFFEDLLPSHRAGGSGGGSQKAPSAPTRTKAPESAPAESKDQKKEKVRQTHVPGSPCSVEPRQTVPL